MRMSPRYTAAANAALMTAARNRCVLEVNTSAVYRGFARISSRPMRF